MIIDECIRLRWGKGNPLLRSILASRPLGRLGVDPGVGTAWNGIGTDSTYPLRLLSGWTQAAGCGPGAAGATRLHSLREVVR
jgi:hypothetical protein